MAFPSRPLSRRRAKVLAEMRKRHAVVAPRFQSLFGLVLSEQVPLIAALFESLDASERVATLALELDPGGVTDWYTRDFEKHDGLDLRLHHRYWCDPPEFVTVILGGSDGHHVGLFHDEPSKAPWLAPESWARDGGESSSNWNGRRETLLDGLHRRARKAVLDGIAAEPLIAAVEEFSQASAEVVDREHRPKQMKPISRLRTLNGTGPVLPAKQTPNPGWPSREARREAFAEDKRKVIEKWVRDAQRELEAGAVGLALLLGSDLFWVRKGWEAQGVELLDAAYRACGREAFAEILRVHHAHRDLQSVQVLR